MTQYDIIMDWVDEPQLTQEEYLELEKRVKERRGKFTATFTQEDKPLTLQKESGIMEQSQAAIIDDSVGRKRRYNNTVGRITYELLYGDKFEEVKGLTRVINLTKFSKHLQLRQPNIVEKLRFMEGMGIISELHIDYKTVHVTMAPPAGIKRKGE